MLVFSKILDQRYVCCLLIPTDGASLTAANTLANTGTSDSRLIPPLASDRSFRKKPGSLLTRDSDSDSDSEEERARQRERVRANGGPGCSSNSASGATDGPSTSRIEAEIAGAGAAHGHNHTAFLKVDSSEVDRDRNEQEERDDGFGQRKKKTKPSARKAANLSGSFSFLLLLRWLPLCFTLPDVSPKSLCLISIWTASHSPSSHVSHHTPSDILSTAQTMRPSWSHTLLAYRLHLCPYAALSLCVMTACAARTIHWHSFYCYE